MLPRTDDSMCQKNLGGGEYWHLKRITKPKFEHKPHLVIKQDILSETAFYKKIYLCSLSFKWHLRNLCSPYEG